MKSCFYVYSMLCFCGMAMLEILLRGMFSPSISSSSTFEVWSIPICSIFELSSLFPFIASFVLITNELTLEDCDWIKVWACGFVVSKILHRYMHSY